MNALFLSIGHVASMLGVSTKTLRRWDKKEALNADLRQQGLFPSYINTVPVSSFNSQICAECFQATGEQVRSRKKGIPYHEFTCTTCERNTHEHPVVHRHSNSARMNALLVQRSVYSNGLTTS